MPHAVTCQSTGVANQVSGVTSATPLAPPLLTEEGRKGIINNPKHAESISSHLKLHSPLELGHTMQLVVVAASETFSKRIILYLQLSDLKTDS